RPLDANTRAINKGRIVAVDFNIGRVGSDSAWSAKSVSPRVKAPPPARLQRFSGSPGAAALRVCVKRQLNRFLRSRLGVGTISNQRHTEPRAEGAVQRF